MRTTQRWRRIEGFPRYEVSDWGRVRRIGARKNLKISFWGDWPVVNITNSDGEQITCNVSRLVLTTFVGPPKNGQEACHYPDRDRRNNHLRNLRWDSHKENAGDMLRHGTQCKGEDCHSAKLTESQVLEIRQRYSKGGIRQVDLAYEFGVSSHLIYLIVKNKVWKHLSLVENTDFTNRRGNGFKRA